MSTDTIGKYKVDCFVELAREVCGECGVQFAYPATMLERCINDHTRRVYCPNGHSLHYSGPTALERERNGLRRELARAQDAHAETRADLAQERKQHAATKGKLTKTCNRIQRGICPFCNRHFMNVERHMASKHAEEA